MDAEQMKADREYVESKWERVVTGAAALHLSDYCSSIMVNGEEFSSWSAAADFTRQREEDIRQLRKEIDSWHGLRTTGILNLRGQIRNVIYETFVAKQVVDIVIVSRTLARLQAALDDLLHGMRLEGK